MLLAIAIAGLMIGGFSTVLGSARATGSGPDTGCTPATQHIYFSGESYNSTNASVRWTEAGDVPTYFYWGNTTAYGYSILLQPTTKYSVALDFLQPSKTYHFEIYAAADCIGLISYSLATYTGQFTTNSESVYINSYGYTIAGTISNTAGAKAPQYVIVETWCLSDPEISWYAWAYTNSVGHYSLNVYDPTTQSDWCSQYGSGGAGAYVVTFGYAVNGYWQGYWNETIDVWAPQVVNFVTPANALGPWLPIQLEYTNSQYVTLSFTQSDSITTTYTLEVAGNGQSAGSSFTVSESGSATGKDNEVWVKYM